MAKDVVPVILCGGPGTRLWPLSTADKPKPFHQLAGEGTLFQQVLKRATLAPFTRRPIVVAQSRNAALVRSQADALGMTVDLVLEKEGRDTCVAALAGALLAERLHGPCLLGLLASDQFIPDLGAFAQMLTKAVPAARDGALVVFGVAPRSPSSAFGYIVSDEGGGEASTVRRFVEKPAEDVARDLIASGARWNSGNFLVSTATLLAAAVTHAPAIHAAVTSALLPTCAADDATEFAVSLDRSQAPSLDRAIVERFADVRMIAADFAWSDVGTWDEVRALSAFHGPFTMSAGQAVRVVGLEDVIVVATADGVLVTRAGQSRQLKEALEQDLHKSN